MIEYSNEEGFIPKQTIKFREGQDKNIILPKIAVGVFSRHLFYDTVKEYNAREVGYISCANFERNVYILNYNGRDVTFFMAGVGAPIIAGDIEQLAASGVEKFIIFGNCGVLDKNIPDCSIIIPTKGFREEGTSYHYLKDSKTIDMNLKYKEEFKNVLEKNDYEYTEGFTWTTDAFFRETRDKIKRFKELGAVCVEMEGTAIAAVCDYLNLDYFTFYYAGDNLDNNKWDQRSLSGLTNFNKKQKVKKLAFDLANKISENK